jgi:hypothetical protein
MDIYIYRPKPNTSEEERLNIDIFNDHTTVTSSLNGMIGGGNTEYINDKAQSVDQFEDIRRREQTLSEDTSLIALHNIIINVQIIYQL